MTELTRFSQKSDFESLGFEKNTPIFKITCPVCGLPLCPHGICANSESEYACSECALSTLMNAMKHVSVVSGPAMDMKEYRAFMDAMGIFSRATKEIWEGR